MRIAAILHIILFSWVTVFAQDDLSAKSLFDEDKEVKEFLYQGVLNGVHQIKMRLGIKGNICKGFYSYSGSKLTFQLEGTYQEEFFELHELDQNLKVSANIFLERDDDLLKGQWTHIDKKIGFPISAIKVKSFNNDVNDCRENSWQNTYHGVLEQQNISIRLTKESDSDLFVNMTIASIPFDFTADCDSPQCRFFRHDFKDQTGLFEELEFRRIDSSYLNITMIKPDRSRELVGLRLYETLSYDCIDYSSYTSRYNLIYPKLKNLFFNKTIRTIVGDWETSVIQDIDSLELLSPGQIPTDRFTYEATGWVDITQFNNQIISGVFTFQKNWQTTPQRKVFNFDLSQNKEITTDLVFKSSFDYKKYFESFIAEQKKNYLPFKHKYISDWVKTQKFNHINYTAEGIIFSSDFSNIYGSHQVLLPYTDIKKHLHKNFKKSLAIK